MKKYRGCPEKFIYRMPLPVAGKNTTAGTVFHVSSVQMTGAGSVERILRKRVNAFGIPLRQTLKPE